MDTEPPFPKSAQEVFEIFKNCNLKTNLEGEFVLTVEEVKGIITFGRATNLKWLCGSNAVYMDGTFKCCTKYFKQLLVINGHYIPAKTAEVYLRILKYTSY